MPTYRVLRGTYRRDDGTRAEPGDTVELTEERRARLPAESYERVDDSPSDDVAPSLAETNTDVDTTDTTTNPDTDTDDDAGADETTADVDVSTGTDVAPDLAETDTDDLEASGDVPDDYTLLSKMAKHYEGDEVHGSTAMDELTEFFGELSDTEVAHLKESARAELEE